MILDDYYEVHNQVGASTIGYILYREVDTCHGPFTLAKPGKRGY